MGQPIPRGQFDVDIDPLSVPTLRVPRVRRAALKVPEIVIYFWIAKLLTTALGESTSDYLVYHVNPYLAVAVCGFALAVALHLQLAARRYIAWVYWLAVVMVAIFGTMAADVVHIVLGVPYLTSTVFFSGALAVVFVAWYLVEGTLSIHSVTTLRRELFYWATVMTTFALGTAAGDMTAWTLQLGYFASALLFAALFALPALGYWLLGLNEIAAFWFAYIMTRPLGASIADWLGKPRDASGLGLGDGIVSLVLVSLAIAVVGYLAITRIDVPNDTKRPATRRGYPGR